MSIGAGIAIAGIWLSLAVLAFAPMAGYMVLCAFLGTFVVFILTILPGIIEKEWQSPTPDKHGSKDSGQ